MDNQPENGVNLETTNIYTEYYIRETLNYCQDSYIPTL
jgi:hypothetical protein